MPKRSHRVTYVRFLRLVYCYVGIVVLLGGILHGLSRYIGGAVTVVTARRDGTGREGTVKPPLKWFRRPVPPIKPLTVVTYRPIVIRVEYSLAI